MEKAPEKARESGVGWVVATGILFTAIDIALFSAVF